MAISSQPTTLDWEQTLNSVWALKIAAQDNDDKELHFSSSMLSRLGSDGFQRVLDGIRSLGGHEIQTLTGRTPGTCIIALKHSEKRPADCDVATFKKTALVAALEIDHSPKQAAKKSKDAAKKPLKIPRPPNAFILYRQHHHPLVKASNPELKNNDISCLLGSQWRNESPDIKAKYQLLADEAKARHKKDNPDYHYKPRRPIEKKRRMTRKKLEAISAHQGRYANITERAFGDDIPFCPSPSFNMSGFMEEEAFLVTDKNADDFMTDFVSSNPLPEMLVTALHGKITTPIDPRLIQNMVATFNSQPQYEYTQLKAPTLFKPSRNACEDGIISYQILDSAEVSAVCEMNRLDLEAVFRDFE